MIRLLLSLILLFLAMGSLWAVPPLLNYAGQVSVDGQRFDGEAKLKFALVNPAGTVTYWSQDGTSDNGSEPAGHVSAQVRGGLYSILIGNTAISGMGELNASVFQQHHDVHLRVWFSDGINGFERIVPDRPFAAVPYALSAGSANISPGSISLNMLDTEVQNSLSGTIPNDRLSTDVNNALKPLIAKQPSTVAAVGGSSTLLSVDATGVNNSYQWKKNGVDITGATSRTLSISDLNASQHEGNYTVVVSNAFGSTTSLVAQIDVNGSLTEGLVGWWKFDETEGTVASDSSGNGNDGNLTNGPTWTEGKIGGALSFDGVDDYVDLGYSNLFHNITECSVSIWLSVLSESSTWREIITLQSVQAIALKNTGQFHLNTGNGSSWDGSGLNSNRIIGLNHWYALSICRDSNGAKLFIDGNLEDSSNLYVSSGTANHRTLIGAKDSSGLRHFTMGYFDDLRIYDRALSALEVKALYELGEQPVQESGSGTATVVNGTVADGSITKSMLSQEVLDELNASGGATGSVPGSLIAVPANQSAPSGYELYQRGEPKELVWEEKAPVSEARWAFDGVEVLDGKIYFVGGKNVSGMKNIAERYDPVTNTWEMLSPMSEARQGVASAVLNGKIYAIGGIDLASVEVYDPSTESWSSGVALPSEVNHGTAITVGVKIYLIGGRNSSDHDIDQVLCFDPSSNQWTAMANMPTARNGVKLVWFDNRIWAIAGMGTPANSTLESYDPHTDTWRTEKQLPRARNWPVAWVSHERIYVGGLQYGSHIDYYDPASDSWIAEGNLPQNKYVADAIVLNDKVYVIGGATASNVYSNKVYAADLNASVEGMHDLYVKIGDASTGTPTVQAEVADGSITANQLSEQILKYLKPEITQQPTAVTIFADTNHTISVSAEGKYLTYQWKKNGANLVGETNATLIISDANATLHEGNYSVIISNDFGSIETTEAELEIYPWNIMAVQGVEMWLDSNDSSSIELNEEKVISWNDKSGNENNASQVIDSLRPSYGQDENGTYVMFTSSATESNYASNVLADNYLLVNGISGKSIFFVIDHDGAPVSYLLGSDYPENRSYIFVNPAVGDYSISLDGQTSDSGSWWYKGAFVATGGDLGTINQIEINTSTLHSIIFKQNSPSTVFVRLGSSSDNQGGFGGKIREIITFSSYLSAADRQRIEGYLAHKWNLATDLPSDHPYKNFPP